MNKRRERPEDDLLMLQQVADANPVAGVQFLEHLVLQKRSLVINQKYTSMFRGLLTRNRIQICICN
jgi:hypothetical protein